MRNGLPAGEAERRQGWPRRCTSSVKLTGFRNYASLSLDLDQRHVVLVGDNGAGKTNLMEAVSLLTPGRGMRRAAYGDLIKAGADPALPVSASLQVLKAWPANVDIGTGVDGGEDRVAKVRINGAPARPVDELARALQAFVADPGDGRAVYRLGRRPAAVSGPAGAVGGPGPWRPGAELRTGHAQPQPAVVGRAGGSRLARRAGSADGRARRGNGDGAQRGGEPAFRPDRKPCRAQRVSRCNGAAGRLSRGRGADLGERHGSGLCADDGKRQAAGCGGRTDTCRGRTAPT
jgi:energy-coupling factor transporter ATP-binding protein EcfA2